MGIPLPQSTIEIDGKVVELFRCETDWGLVIRANGYDSQALFQVHAGHHINQPVILEDHEIDLIRKEINGK